ncbi:hypothetical protein [Cellulosilyticum sp. I15G10I2]|uniref:hypothetical protein n=1 Tax=Cellulosilyticum sp. I15G10I2 TaxID=1892843 RepID=UPI00085BF1A9|nr:hypothetical protein [Cellulosilyticum sp. I15G10I2]
MDYTYLVDVDGFETYVVAAPTRNKAISANYRSYRSAGYKSTFIEFKKMVKSCKRFSLKRLEDV